MKINSGVVPLYSWVNSMFSFVGAIFADGDEPTCCDGLCKDTESMVSVAVRLKAC